MENQVQNVKVVRCEQHMRAAVQSVCLKTAHVENAEEAQKQYTLNMYCDNYLKNGIAYVLQAEDRPVGYILCSPDHAVYQEQMKPVLQEIDALGGMYPLMAKAEMSAYAAYAKDFPAHLHIDILEEYTGGGFGVLLMQTLLQELRRQQIPGVMLMVAADNARAIRFYQKHGFQMLQESSHAKIMGQKLN